MGGFDSATWQALGLVLTLLGLGLSAADLDPPRPGQGAARRGLEPAARWPPG